MIGFILPNAGSSRDLQEFAVTVDQVESATGLEFFTSVDGDLRTQLSGDHQPRRPGRGEIANIRLPFRSRGCIPPQSMIY